jgi:riboflavin kinase
MEARESVAVGATELAALKRVALDGALGGSVKVSCAGLGDALDASTQTASRRLQRLEDAGLLDRDVVSDGQWVEVTAAGERELRREYEEYHRLFESPSSLRLVGHVTSGMGEGRHYISLSGYMAQFAERLGYEPFAGTLNVELTEGSVRVRPRMSALDAVPIDGWEDDERTFGPATCYAATLVADDERYDPVHIIVPERTHHDESQLEVIAPVKLRDELGLDDGDEVVAEVEAVDR